MCNFLSLTNIDPPSSVLYVNEKLAKKGKTSHWRKLSAADSTQHVYIKASYMHVLLNYHG